MNAVLQLLSEHFLASPIASAPTAAAPMISQYWISEEEIDAQLKEFEAHCDKLDRALTEAEEVTHFENFFSVVREALKSVGTFDEGGFEESDFASARDADPARILTVTSGVPVTQEIAETVLEACASLGADHAVIFKDPAGRSVLFSNGDFLHEE